MCCKKHILREHFTVYAALYSESKEGWIWITLKGYDGNFITIRNPFNNKSITCMLRTIDDNFIKYYKETNIYDKKIEPGLSVVISEYYRKILGIETHTDSKPRTEKGQVFCHGISFSPLSVHSYNNRGQVSKTHENGKKRKE